VGLFVNEAVFHGDAARRGHGRNEAVPLESRPVLWTNQIEAYAAQLRSFTAAVFEGHLGIEWESGDTLLETSFERRGFSLRIGCSCGADKGGRGNEISASHG
jgi:hypothetical protein